MSRRFLARAAAIILASAICVPTLTSHAPVARADTEGCEPGQVAKIPGPPATLERLGLVGTAHLPTGKGITVAIVDSGIDGTHPQLKDAIDTDASFSFVEDDDPSPLVDVEGHGTAVAGVIGAQPSSEFGSLGVAPDADLISIRVYRASDKSSRDAGLGPSPAGIANGIREAVSRGAQIIVVPLSDPTDHPALRDAALHATSRGSLIVASAGNRTTAQDKSDSPRYPAAYEGVLAVTAIDHDGRATSAAIHGDHLDVAAPGQDVLTVAALAGDCIYATDTPSTSFSTAYTAGVAALLAEAHPEEGPSGWAYRLMATADRPDPDAANIHTGWGIIRPVEALRLRPEIPPRGPVNPLTGESGQEIIRAQSHVSPIDPAVTDWTPHLTFFIVAAGALLILGLAATLRRGSPQLPHEPQSEARAEDRQAQAEEGQ